MVAARPADEPPPRGCGDGATPSGRSIAIVHLRTLPTPDASGHVARMEQDNQDFRSRVSNAVFMAVVEAGRKAPGAADTHVDINVAIEGMAHAMSTFVLTGSQMIDDREMAADMVDSMRKLIDDQLEYFAARIREGTFPIPDRAPPDLRLVD